MIWWGPKVATFGTKTLKFFRFIDLNWIAKIWFEGAQATWLLILILVCCTCILLYTRKCWKKLKKHKALLLLFLSLVAFQLEEGRPFAPPPWLRLWRGRFKQASSWEIWISSTACKTFIGFTAVGLLSLKRFSPTFFSDFSKKKSNWVI